MKRIMLTLAAFSVPTQAMALGVGDLARVVLGNSAVLQKGSDTCGAKASLSLQDIAMIALARNSVQKALPADQFAALTASANTQAVTAAQASNFCDTTVKKKPTLIESIKRAGEKIVTARILKI